MPAGVPPPHAPPGGRRRRSRLLVASGLVAVLVVVGAVVATRGSSGGAGPAGEGSWSYEPGTPTSALVSNEQAVCGTTADGELFCVEAATGDETFRTRPGGGQRGETVNVSNPTLAGDTLLVQTAARGDGLRAYSLDGDPRWSAPVGGGPGTLELTPVVVGDVVGAIATVELDRELVGVDLATGEELWRNYTTHRSDVGEMQLATLGPVTDGERLYVVLGSLGEEDSVIAAVDPATGDELWRTPVGGFGVSGMRATPVEGGAAMAFTFNAVSGSQLAVLDSATGALRWEQPLTSPHHDLVEAGGVIVVADGQELRGYDPAGQQLWSGPGPVAASSGSFEGSLVVEGGVLYDVGLDLHQVDPATGTSQQLNGTGRDGGGGDSDDSDDEGEDEVVLDDGLSASDVARVGDLLVISTSAEVLAVPVAELAPGSG
jgi:outer membrane protein assembly factor BamB